MPVFVEELPGSPKVKLDRAGGTATRIVKVATLDIDAFVRELFPRPFDNYLFSASYPGLPWLRAESMSFEPFLPDTITGFSENPAFYPFTQVTVNYMGPTKRDWGMQSGRGNDRSGPGGPAGSSGGQSTQFLTHKITFGGEQILLPPNSLRFATDKNGNPVVSDTDPNGFAPANVKAGANIGILHHTLTWSYINYPPWYAIRASLGYVNNALMMGAFPETLLFLGGDAQHQYSYSQNQTYWSLTYHFAERCLNYALATADQTVNVPIGWNYYLRPETGRFEKLFRKNTGATQGPYLTADLSQLFVEQS